MTVPYGLGARMKIGTTFLSNMVGDLSIRDGKLACGIDGEGEKPWAPIRPQQLSRFVHVARRWSSAGAKHDHSGRLRRARHHVDSTAD